MIWMFRLLAILIVSGALIRALVSNDRPDAKATLSAAGEIAFREQLGFRPGVSVVAFTARPPQSDQRSSWQVAWLDSTGMITTVHPPDRSDGAAGEAADQSGRSLNRRSRIGGDRTDSPAWSSRFGSVSVAVWAPDEPVYVTAGPDGQPGVAGIDDDGNGVVDDLNELGVTGSDDRVVAPGQPGYRQAAGGEQLAAIISRGAVVTPTSAIHFADPSVDADADADFVTALAAVSAKVERPREVWLEFRPADESGSAYRVLLP